MNGLRFSDIESCFVRTKNYILRMFLHNLLNSYVDTLERLCTVANTQFNLFLLPESIYYNLDGRLMVELMTPRIKEVFENQQRQRNQDKAG